MQTTKVGSLQCSTIWLPNCTTKRLQHIQNATACLIKLTRKHDHVSPIPFNLHWLPVNYHMMFMIFLASSYMRNMLTPYTSTITLIIQPPFFSLLYYLKVYICIKGREQREDQGPRMIGTEKRTLCYYIPP